MTEESKNRVVVIDADGTAVKVKTDAQIVAENERLAAELKGSKVEALLKEREAKKQKQKAARAEEPEMSVVMVEPKRDRSIDIGCIGVGQAGSRIAETFYNYGYPVVAINTASQDLTNIKIPERNKLFLQFALGGAAKSLELGEQAAQQYSAEISKLLEDNFSNSDMLVLAISGGGGSGSGSAETMINLMSKLGRNIMVLYILPLSSEDSLSKSNSITTLSKLANLAKNGTISSLFIIDNSRIEMLNPGLTMSRFWTTANAQIVEPLHLFNVLSNKPSNFTSLDPMDISRVITGGNIPADCGIFGSIRVKDYLEPDSIATAVVSSLENGLLCADFDLSEARSAGIIITGNKKTLEQVQSSSVEFAFSMIPKISNDGIVIYRGIYEIDDEQDGLTIYSFFSGLGLPQKRILQLQEEVARQIEIIKDKESGRTAAMDLNLGKTTAVSASDALFKKIQQKNSPMGKIIDRRRR